MRAALWAAVALASVSALHGRVIPASDAVWMSCYRPTPWPCARLALSVLQGDVQLGDVELLHARLDGDADAVVVVNGVHTLTLPMRANTTSSTVVVAPSSAWRRGVNTLEVLSPLLSDGKPAATAVSMPGAVAPPAHGAPLPYVEVEAEACDTTGVVLGPNFTFTSLASEASRRIAVQLTSPQQYLDVAVPTAVDAVSIRFSVPDAVGGGGLDTLLSLFVNGVWAVDTTLTSRYAWYYGAYPFTKNPADGLAHHFYDEVTVLLDKPLVVGDTLRLAPSSRVPPSAFVAITLDVVDLYNVGPPLSQPPGSLSVVSFGADATGALDSSSAFAAAVAAAQRTGAIVWVPPGNFTVTSHILVNNVTLAGAGPWYATLHGAGVGVYGGAGPASVNVHVRDVTLRGEVMIRNDAAQTNGIGGGLSDSIVANVWITHTKCGMWLDGPMQSLLVTGVTIRGTTADGINFHRGVEGSVVEYTTVRNTGDDGLAMWSDGVPDANCTFRFNTVQVPVLANAIAVYGGADNAVVGNAVADSVTQGGGLHVGNRFGAVPLSGTTTLSANLVTRCGCLDPNWHFGVGAVWLYALDEPMTGAVLVADTVLADSPYEALQFIGSSVTGVVLSNVTVGGVGTFVLQLQSRGSASATGVVATGVGFFGVYDCGAGFTLQDGGGNSGWSTTHCGFPPTLSVSTPRPDAAVPRARML
jgi:hypothetical protein